jgi:hypothetical protein
MFTTKKMAARVRRAPTAWERAVTFSETVEGTLDSLAVCLKIIGAMRGQNAGGARFLRGECAATGVRPGF